MLNCSFIQGKNHPGVHVRTMRIFRAFPRQPSFLLIILKTLVTMFPMMVTIPYLTSPTKVTISLISHLEGLVRLLSPRPRPERPTRLIPAALVTPLCKREMCMSLPFSLSLCIYMSLCNSLALTLSPCHLSW